MLCLKPKIGFVGAAAAAFTGSAALTVTGSALTVACTGSAALTGSAFTGSAVVAVTGLFEMNLKLKLLKHLVSSFVLHSRCCLDVLCSVDQNDVIRGHLLV